MRNGTVVSGTVTSLPGSRAAAVRRDRPPRLAKTYSADADLVWHPTDASTLHLKAGYTKANGNTESQPFYEGAAPGAFTFDISGKVPQVKFTGIDPTQPSNLILDFASLHKITNTDEEKYFYVDYEHRGGLGPAPRPEVRRQVHRP